MTDVASELDLVVHGDAAMLEKEGMAQLRTLDAAVPGKDAVQLAGPPAVKLPDFAQDEQASGVPPVHLIGEWSHGSFLLAPAAASSSTLVGDDLHSATSPKLSLNLLSRAAGRPRLTQVARDLATTSNVTTITSERVAEAIDGGTIASPRTLGTLAHLARPAALPLSEPDLLFVFGGSYLRLRGFPPWQLRLSEM